MKYKINKSDLFIHNKLHPEGSEIDLTKEQTKGIEDFLIECHSERNEESDSKSHPEQSEGSQIKETKTKGNKK